MGGTNRCERCGDAIPPEKDQCRDCRHAADVHERVGSPDVATDGSISGKESEAGRVTGPETNRSVPLLSPSVVWLRLKLVSGQILMLCSLLLSFAGLYVAIAGYRHNKSFAVDFHGIIVESIDLGSFILLGSEVLITVGVLLFMTGMSIMYKLTNGSAGY